MIFSGEEPKIIETELYIEKLKYLFKTHSRKIVFEIHSEDWDELELSLAKSLEDHFKFWNSKVEEINQIAKISVKKLEKFQLKEKRNFKEFLEKIESLLPKDTKEVKALEDAKDVLFSEQEFKDARYIKKRAIKLKNLMIEKTIKKRKRKIKHQQELDENKKVKEREALLYIILRVLEKTGNRRKKEFEKLWVKYTKVKRIIENLHHQENCRMRDLESKIDPIYFFFLIVLISFFKNKTLMIER